MRRFKIYGLSSALIATVFAIALILYIVLNNILVIVLAMLLLLLLLLLTSMFQPSFHRKLSGTAELRDTALNARKSEIVGMICKDCKETAELLEAASEETDTTSAQSELERLGKELAYARCCSSSFEIETDELNHVDLTFLTTKSTEVRDRLGAIKRSVASSYGATMKRHNEDCDDALRQLVSAGFKINDLYARFRSISSKHSEGILEELVENEKEIAAITSRMVLASFDELKGIISNEPSRNGIAGIREAIKEFDCSTGDLKYAPKLSSLRLELRGLLEDDFLEYKEQVLDSMRAVVGASKCEPFSEFNRELEVRIEGIMAITDPGAIGNLRKSEADYREFIRYSLDDISKKAKALHDELLMYKPPRDMAVKIPKKIDVPKGNLADFTKRLTTMFSELSPSMEALYRNTKIMRSYPKVERLIDFRLKESGELNSKDIDIQYQDTFFMLYAKRHSKMKYVSSPESKLIRGA
ncbi:MAG: hypothetical protein ABIG39_00520 [Candidatus Micrarchaeota archaeon]